MTLQFRCRWIHPEQAEIDEGRARYQITAAVVEVKVRGADWKKTMFHN